MSILQKTHDRFNDVVIRNALVSHQGSKSFLRKLLPVAVSYILHQRINFDREDFTLFKRNGTVYTNFKTNPKSFALKEIQNWLKGVSEAIHKNYLRELYLVFSKDSNVILESYKFKFKNLGETSTTREQLRNSTCALLEAIYFLDQYPCLDFKETDIKMVLTYYEDETPNDYNPPHFENHSTKDMPILSLLSSHSDKVCEFGQVKTKFHTLKCRGKSEMFTIDKDSSCSTSLNNVEENNCEIEGINAKPFANTNDSILKTSVDTPIIGSSNNIKINCLCGLPYKFENIDILTCTNCFDSQHCVCEGYLSKKEVEDHYRCKYCKMPNMAPSDYKSMKLNTINRLLITNAYLTNSFPEQIIDKLPEKMKIIILNKLEMGGLISKNGTKNYSINMNVIKTYYLQSVFKNSNVQLSNRNNMCSDSNDNASEKMVYKPSPKKRRCN